MGSINDDTDFSKGQHPSLSRFQTELDKWNEQCKKRAAAVPLIYRLLGWSIKWQMDHWYDGNSRSNHHDRI